MENQYQFNRSDVVSVARVDHKWYGYILNEIPDTDGDVSVVIFYFYCDSNKEYIRINEYISSEIILNDIVYDKEEQIFITPKSLELIASAENERVLAGVGFELVITHPGENYGHHVIVEKIISGMLYQAPDFLICKNKMSGRMIILTADMVKRVEDIEEIPLGTIPENTERLDKALIIYIKYYRKQYKRFMMCEITKDDLFLWKTLAKEKLVEFEIGGITIEEFEKSIQP